MRISLEKDIRIYICQFSLGLLLLFLYISAVFVTGHWPIKTWTGPEGSRKLRFPDFMTTAQNVGKISLTHRPPLPP